MTLLYLDLSIYFDEQLSLTTLNPQEPEKRASTEENSETTDKNWGLQELAWNSTKQARQRQHTLNPRAFGESGPKTPRMHGDLGVCAVCRFAVSCFSTRIPEEPKIADAQAEIAKYNALDENNRTQVFEYLDKWRRQGESMATDVVTKFTNNHLMEQVILAVLNKHQANIDNAFTDSDGNPKPVGTTVAISDTIAQSDVGVGYELDAKMEVVSITRALQGLQIHLVISGPYETAYLKPRGVI